MGKILIGGHRGLGATDSDAARAQYRDHASLPPENTLESLVGAFVAGADFIEFDVVPAEDGLIVCHSAKLAEHVFSSPWPASAAPIYTAQLPVAALAQLTVGHRAEPQDRMPTLEAVLTAVKPYLTGARFLNLEIKGLQGTGETFSETAQTGFITAILQSVHNAGLMERTVFSSFRAGVLRSVRGILPAAKLAQLFVARDEPGCLTCTDDHIATVARVMPEAALHLPLSRFAGDACPKIPDGATVNIWADKILPVAEIIMQCQMAAAHLPHVRQLGFIVDYPVELKTAFA